MRAVLRGLAAYRRRNPGSPPVAVGDLSLRHGGEIDGHSTHEHGRQIDLYLPRRGPRKVVMTLGKHDDHLHAMF